MADRRGFVHEAVGQFTGLYKSLPKNGELKVITVLINNKYAFPKTSWFNC